MSNLHDREEAVALMKAALRHPTPLFRKYNGERYTPPPKFKTRKGMDLRDEARTGVVEAIHKAWEDQERNEVGQWTAGGGGGMGNAPKAVVGRGTISAPSAQLLAHINPEHLLRLDAVQAVVLGGMYRSAAEAKPEFDRNMTEVAKAVEGSAALPGLKGSARAAEKIIDDYKGQAAGIKDLLRGTVNVSSIDAAQGALNDIKGKFEVLPTGQRNLLSPTAPDPVDGYRDIKLNVRMSNGIVAEVQVNVPELLAVKEKFHKEYEERRVIQGRAEKEGRPLTARENEDVERLNATMKAAYDPVWARLTGKG